MMAEEKEEWDGPWKEALDNLDLVFGLFWPDVVSEVDLSKGWTPLEQEIQKLTPDGTTRGLLRVDKLVEMTAKDSGDPRFAHFEAQMTRDIELPWRMFRYGRRAGEHFHQPVGSFVVLGDDASNWKPDSYREGVLGCEQTTTFRVAKLSEWRERILELESGSNLFGLFVCAHLETMATRGDVPRRQEVKYRLLANLLRRDISTDDFRRWYRLIDWIVKLPEDANRAVWLRLQQIKEPKTMSYITFAELIGIEKGIEQGIEKGIEKGIEQGIEKGIKQGIEKGIEKGRTEGLKEALRGLLLAKFLGEGPALVEEFEKEVNPERLSTLLQAAGMAGSLEDFRARISSSSP